MVSMRSTAENGAAARGVCALTETGDRGDCQMGEKGSLRAYNKRECAQFCRRCSRCRFISFSQLDLDCSWFHDCPEQLGQHGTDHLTYQVFPRTGTVNFSHRRSLTVWVDAEEVGSALWPGARRRKGHCRGPLAHPKPTESRRPCPFVLKTPEYGVFSTRDRNQQGVPPSH